MRILLDMSVEIESLNWKPANMNSIDFMVTVKQSNGIEDVKIKYLNSNISADNIIRYKVIMKNYLQLQNYQSLLVKKY